MENQDRWATHSTYDLIMVGQVCFAVLAAVYLLGVEVDVVGEAHLGIGDGLSARERYGSVWERVTDV